MIFIPGRKLNETWRLRPPTIYRNRNHRGAICFALKGSYADGTNRADGIKRGLFSSLFAEMFVQ